MSFAVVASTPTHTLKRQLHRIPPNYLALARVAPIDGRRPHPARTIDAAAAPLLASN